MKGISLCSNSVGFLQITYAVFYIFLYDFSLFMHFFKEDYPYTKGITKKRKGQGEYLENSPNKEATKLLKVALSCSSQNLKPNKAPEKNATVI